MRTLLRNINLRKFRKVFGFVPTKGGRIRTLEQRIVSSVLRNLAGELDSFYKRENGLYADVVGLDASELFSVRAEIAALYFALQATKQSFWQAHKLAKEAGFSVKEKYSDYLRSDFDL